MIDGKRILGLVPARGGSKRLSGKNLMPLCGLSLLGWTIKAARESCYIDDIIVSTDDEGIAAEARRCAADVPFLRPPELAQDTSSVVDVCLHLLDQLGERWAYLVLLQPTSPLRTAADIDRTIDLCHRRSATSAVTVTRPYKAVEFLCRSDDEGRLRKLSLGPADARFWCLNGAVYVIRPAALRDTRRFLAGDTLFTEMPFARSIDVDTLFDFKIVEFVMANPDLRP